MQSFDHYLNEFNEIGYVEAVAGDAVSVNGLPSVKPEEIVIFENGELGQVLFLKPKSVEVLLLGQRPVKSGTKVGRTNEKLFFPVGEEILGYIVDPLGVSKSGKGGFKQTEKRLLKISPPGISSRVQIKKQLETGVNLVDMLLPLGFGQRELIIGDRKTGKTAFLLQTALNQIAKGTICIWAVIGKRSEEIKLMQEFFERHKVMDKVVIIASSAEDPTGLIYLTPFSAVTLAEYFKDQGRDTLVVLDDLTLHAKFYRQLSLTSKRFPGRESYPVDIFFTHSAILERGGNFERAGKEVSLSIMPICETNEGDLSGYIQTNLMSMTDGHLFFDRELFSEGRRPAINPFLSVTRVGRQTQSPLDQEISQFIMSFLVKYQKMMNYLHFGTELTDETRAILEKGSKIVAFFDQKSSDSIPGNAGLFVFILILNDFWKEKETADFQKESEKIYDKYRKDGQFSKAVDELISSAKDFRVLKERIRQFNF